MVQPMGISDCIERRRSIRKYIKNKKLTESQIVSLLDAARLAPSSSNRQDWEMVLVEESAVKEELIEACDKQTFVGDCSMFIAGISTAEHEWSEIDVAIALEHIALTAVQMDLGTCWMGAFDKEKISGILNIPKNKELVICMSLGFPDETPPPTTRKDLTQLIIQNGY
jgi:nitroreductase